jgi:hypothetical protein
MPKQASFMGPRTRWKPPLHVIDPHVASRVSLALVQDTGPVPLPIGVHAAGPRTCHIAATMTTHLGGGQV